VTPDPLPADLADALSALEPGLAREISLRYFSDVESTNDIALALAEAGAPDGTAVLADFQRAGRGRRGRSWFSPPGAGMYLSSIVRTSVDPDATTSAWPMGLLTLAAGVAVAEAVRSITGLPVELKWPNDVVVGRPWRKLAGVLCESAGAGARVDAIVVGMGINLRLAAYPPELSDRATSIEAELGRPTERAVLVVECLRRLAGRVRQLRQTGREGIVGDWRTLGRAGLNGASVRWRASSGERRGLAREIDADGALLVERDGQLERIIAGEVLWDRMS
jgi:BirA family biotin operon repressor/biotin-[acetyl-CoA-carboxylase] ligase